MRPELRPFADELARLLPAGTPVVDAHTHLGVDEDGMRLAPERLHAMLDDIGAEQAVVFPLHDPDRRPAYRAPNDRVLAWAAESGGRFVPFCRLDPQEEPVREAERCLDAGAKGIKLHPRAQAFDFAHSSLGDVFRLAHERGVPILIHAGRGMAPVAERLCDLALDVPSTLILAHAGIAEQGVFTSRLRDHPAAFFDTSVFGPFDIGELLSRVPPERILYASDPPYGRPLAAAYATARLARAAGVDDAGLRDIMGANARRILAGEAPRAPGAPPRDRRVTIDGVLLRIYVLVMSAIGQLQAGDAPGARWTLDLAHSACRDPEPGGCGPTLERIAGCLDHALRDIERGRTAPGPMVWLPLVLAVSAGLDA